MGGSDSENDVGKILRDFVPEQFSSPMVFTEHAPPPPPNTEVHQTRQGITPPATPSRVIDRFTSPPVSTDYKRGYYSDRHIPSRIASNLEDALDIAENRRGSFGADREGSSSTRLNPSQRDSGISGAAILHDNQTMMNSMIRSELLGQSLLDYGSGGGFGSGLMDTTDTSGNTAGAVGVSNPTITVVGSSGGVAGASSSSGSLPPAFFSPPRRDSSLSGATTTPTNLFKYRSASHGSAGRVSSSSGRGSLGGADEDDSLRIGSSSTPGKSSLASAAAKKPARKISKTPFKVLDAPALQDDYYLNLVDWSGTNMLSVALGTAVYLWSANTSKVSKLCEFPSEDAVTSIAWAKSGNQLAIGLNSGAIQIWDSSASQMIQQLKGHESRVGSLSWTTSLLASGSRDRSIKVQDIRMKPPIPSTVPSSGSGSAPGSASRPRGTPGRSPAPGSTISAAPTTAVTSSSSPFADIIQATAITSTLDNTTREDALSSVFGTPTRSGILSRRTSAPSTPINSSMAAAATAAAVGVVSELRAHHQEVCGLKWSFDEKMLASGGNDNKLYVWDARKLGRNVDPMCRFEDHTAAVKAVAWSPHQHGLLASGGGTADRHIRFWNATTNLPLHKIDTGSQVCNLMWSKSVNEIVSTHGYSLNQVIIWKYPSMQKVITLSGHSYRVLYLAMSPDGQTIVTGAGDETLRFWNVFPPPKNKNGTPLGQTMLIPSPSDVR